MADGDHGGGSCVNKGTVDGQLGSVVCHICGKYFLPDSIHTHFPSCRNSRSEVFNHLTTEIFPPELESKFSSTFSNIVDKALPLDLPKNETQLKKYNEQALKWFQESFIPCPACNRTFHHNRVEFHFTNCTKKNEIPHSKQRKSKQDEERTQSKEPPLASMKNRKVICYLCGEEVELEGLSTHNVTCLLERPSPVNGSSKDDEFLCRPPDILPPNVNSSDKHVEAYNSQAIAVFKKLKPCPECGKMFNSRWMETHQKRCRLKPPPSQPEDRNSSVHRPHSADETEQRLSPGKKSLALLKSKGRLKSQSSKQEPVQLSIPKAPNGPSPQSTRGHLRSPSLGDIENVQQQCTVKPSPSFLLPKTPAKQSKIPVLSCRASPLHSYPKNNFRNEILHPQEGRQELKPGGKMFPGIPSALSLSPEPNRMNRPLKPSDDQQQLYCIQCGLKFPGDGANFKFCGSCGSRRMY